MKLETRYQVGLVVLILIGVLVTLSFRTIIGVYNAKCGHWEEEAFTGRPLNMLNEKLLADNRSLTWCDPVFYSAIVGGDLAPNQRVMKFSKGRPYSWFGFGTVQNIGLVVIQVATNGESVVTIVRTVSVDSL
jgi:hypothetical protein